MITKNQNSINEQSGFALILVIGLILLMSVFSIIAYRHLLIEKLHLKQIISREGVFQEAEKRLHICLDAININLATPLSQECCLIEKSNHSKTDIYFRVSVHVIDHLNPNGYLDSKNLISQSRQQALLKFVLNRKNQEVLSRQLISWREILDPIWDQELNQTSNTPWELIQPCIWQSEISS